MKLHIISVHHKLPNWASDAIADYVKRMPPDCAIVLKELKPDINPAKEAQKIREAIPKSSYVVAMDERGKDISTQALSEHLAHWRTLGQDITLLIGGADGLDPELKKEAQLSLRLSSLTLPHAMAKLLLIEQLYRAWTILQGHPYHRV